MHFFDFPTPFGLFRYVAVPPAHDVFVVDDGDVDFSMLVILALDNDVYGRA